MVSVSCVPMDVFGEGATTGALALPLIAASRRDHLHRFVRERWEVEVRSSSEHVVARTDKEIAFTALLNEGIEMAHRGMDLNSVQEYDNLVTRSPADEHIVLRRDDGRTTVRFRTLCDLGFEFVVGQQEIRRADGTVERQHQPAPPAWTPAFRFYRLAQGSRDLFDAYRNMFLALEALLDGLSPKRKREREKEWLRRAVIAAGVTSTLADVVEGTGRDLSDLVDLLYNARVHLFHAKTGRTFIPDDRVSYTKVADAYPLLVSLWRDIAHRWLGVGPSGGGMTYHGFRQTVGSLLRSVKVAVTADDTPFSVTETEASPKGMRVTICPSRQRLWKNSLGGWL